MRYFIIINPPEYRDNEDDRAGFAWAGEAADEDDAKLKAIADCEDLNGWDEGSIDADDTDVIECGPDWRHMVEEARKVLATTDANSEPDAMASALTRIAEALGVGA